MIQINWKKILTYAVSLLIPLGLGALTGYLISGSMDYAMLNKPPLAPPPFLFPVAWSLLYLLMGISYGILRTRGLADTAVNTAYFGQLAVNLLWPVFFFVLKWRCVHVSVLSSAEGYGVLRQPVSDVLAGLCKRNARRVCVCVVREPRKA